jgi:hypothetical protein
MQNLPLPNIFVQEVFYLHQLWVNVFCIHDLKNNNTKLYVYHEGEANKSPDEVCSFLWHYIQNEVPNSTKKLLLFSDGAAGQNKNYTVSRFLLNLCDSNRFKSIIHFFPTRGHSFLLCDRDFGAIKHPLRKKNVYTRDGQKVWNIDVPMYRCIYIWNIDVGYRYIRQKIDVLKTSMCTLINFKKNCIYVIYICMLCINCKIFKWIPYLNIELRIRKKIDFFSIHHNKNIDVGFRYIERKHRCF